MQDGILSIQSAVAYGHVGNSAAVFPLQRLGFEVWPVNTVLFSNHTGYGAWRGRVVGLDWVEEIIEGMADRGAIPRTRAVLSGYLGDASLGEAVLRVVERVRAARPDMLYACDPVMGDEGRGFFVRPGHPRVLPRPGGPGGRHRHAQPVRAGLARRPRDQRPGGRAGRGGAGARHRPADRRLHEPGRRQRRTSSASWRTAPRRAGCAARRACRSRSTAPAMPSPPCSWATG